MTEQQREDCPPRSSLRGFSAGTLEEADADRLSEHLTHCEPCVETIDSMRDTSGTVAEALRRVDVGNEYLDEPELIQGLEQLGSLRAAMETVVGGTEDTADASLDPAAATAAPSESDSRESASSKLLDRPETLGNYRLISKLGQGGMGAVYKAVHSSLDKTVAVKVLSVARFGNRDATERFTREMKAMGRVQHPNVVIAHDGGDIDGEHFLVMEYVDGVDISALDQRHQGLPVSVACEIVRQAAIGLQHAHDVGLIHRDIKPSNLMLDQSGVVKVLDLGLARISSDLSSITDASGNEDATQSELTNQGTAMGTMGYMAPEQALDSRSVDARADLYSLGATLYKLLAGTLPFPSDQYDTNGKMLVAIATKTPASIATLCSDLPADLIELVDRTLAKNPADRVATAREFAEQLKPFAGGNLAGLAGTPAGELPKVAAETLPEIRTSAAPNRNKPRRWGFVATAAAGLVVLMLSMQTFWVRTEYGMLKVEIADEQVEARLKVDGISVIDKANNKVWDIKTNPSSAKSLPEGEYRFQAPEGLMITDESGLEIKATELKLVDANKQLRIRVSLASSVENQLPEPGESTSANDPYAQDRKVYRWLRAIGGRAFSVRSWARGQLNDEHLAAPDPFEIAAIELRGTTFRPDELQLLTQLPNLRFLDLSSTKVDSEGLRHVLQIPNLQKLFIDSSNLKSSDLETLGQLRHLGQLRVHAKQLPDNWDFLTKLKALRVLWIQESNNGIPSLTKIPQRTGLLEIDAINAASIPENELQAIFESNPFFRYDQGSLTNKPGKKTNQRRQVVPRELASKGWILRGTRMRNSWKNTTEWSSLQADAWSDDYYLDFQNLVAPSGHSFVDSDYATLKAMKKSCQRISFARCGGLQGLPSILLGRKVEELILSDASLDDALLHQIATHSVLDMIDVTGTDVTRDGIAAFKSLQPTCLVRSSFGSFPAEHRLPTHKEAHEKDIAVASPEESLVRLVHSLGGSLLVGASGPRTSKIVLHGEQLVDTALLVSLLFDGIKDFSDLDLRRVAHAVRQCPKLRLRLLNLSETSVTANGLMCLEGLRFYGIHIVGSCVGLDIDDVASQLSQWQVYDWTLGNAISGKGLQTLAQSKNCRIMRFSCERVSPEELSVMKDRSFNSLDLQLVDSDPEPYLQVLKQFSDCKSVSLRGNIRPTERQFGELSSALLKSTIYWNSQVLKPSLTHNVSAIQDGSLLLDGDLQLTEAAPLGEYEIQIDVQRRGEPDGFILDLPVADSSTRLTLGGRDGVFSALAGTDVYIPGDPFADNAKHRVGVRVSQDAVKVWIDESILINWSGDSNQLVTNQRGSQRPPGIWLRSYQPYEVSQLQLSPDIAEFERIKNSPMSNQDGGDPYTHDREAARWVLSVGGKVFDGGHSIELADIDHPQFKITEVNLSGKKFAQADLAVLAKLPELTSLWIKYTSLDAVGMEHVCRCKSLQRLQLDGVELPLAELKRLAQLPNLRRLGLSEKHLAEGWDIIATLPKLHFLQMWSSEIPNIEPLAAHPSIQILSMSGEGITLDEIQKVVERNPKIVVRCSDPEDSSLRNIYGGAGVREAARQLWKSGWTLSGGVFNRDRVARDEVPWNPNKPSAWAEDQPFSVYSAEAPEGHRLTEQDVQRLNCFGPLARLKLIDTANVEILSDVPLQYNCDYADLRGSSLDDQTLVELGSQNPLGFLNVENTMVTEEGIKAFRKVRPNCRVSSSFGLFTAEHRLPTARSRSMEQGNHAMETTILSPDAELVRLVESLGGQVSTVPHATESQTNRPITPFPNGFVNIGFRGQSSFGDAQVAELTGKIARASKRQFRLIFAGTSITSKAFEDLEQLKINAYELNDNQADLNVDPIIEQLVSLETFGFDFGDTIGADALVKLSANPHIQAFGVSTKRITPMALSAWSDRNLYRLKLDFDGDELADYMDSLLSFSKCQRIVIYDCERPTPDQLMQMKRSLPRTILRWNDQELFRPVTNVKKKSDALSASSSL